MDENINESVETQDVAEPETEALEGAEEQEVAEPDTAEDSTEVESTGRTEADAAFAEMRRQNQQLEREKQMLMESLGLYFEGETAEDLSINANAYAEKRDPDEYREEWQQTQELEATRAERDDLRQQLFEARADQMMREDLAVIQEIDPTVKSLDDLGEPFLRMRLNPEQPLTPEQAYYACKALELNEKVLAPDAIGKVADTKAERDYYTSKELDALTDEDLKDDAVYEKAMRSMQKL